MYNFENLSKKDILTKKIIFLGKNRVCKIIKIAASFDFPKRNILGRISHLYFRRWILSPL